jgi:hypothetical protein
LSTKKLKLEYYNDIKNVWIKSQEEWKTWVKKYPQGEMKRIQWMRALKRVPGHGGLVSDLFEKFDRGWRRHGTKKDKFDELFEEWCKDVKKTYTNVHWFPFPTRPVYTSN